MSLTIDKTKRYDRQLRLWGEHGQTSLENARVCLIGSNGVGAEILKNLILPGVGKITIVDDALITVEDLSNNFFICDSDLNQSRAETTARYLRELNEEVMVSHIDDSVESLLAYNPDFFLNFSIVIACGINNKDLVGLDRLLYPENIALVVCYSLGMVASLRIIIREHSVFDSRPDNVLADLRLDKPLSEFSEFCNSQDLNTMSHKDIAHCPWIVILYKYLQIFQQQHCRWPESYKDKGVLKDLIQEGGYYYQKLTHTGDGGNNNEYFDSFEEAKKAVSTSVMKTEIPANVLSILNDPRSININKDSRPFWVLVSAVRDFVSNEGQGMLPLRGDIPDMTADSDRYISIQRMYRNEADRNAAIIEAHVQRLCQTFEICMTDELRSDNIHRFAKNCHNIHIMSSCSLERELKTSPSHTEDLICAETDQLLWYLSLRAAVSFFTAEGRWPGQKLVNFETDLPNLRRLLQQDVDSCGRLKGATVKDDYLLEICRYSGVELHSVVAFIGGVAAQEVVKLITGLYVPITQPLMYNAIKQTTDLIDI